MKSVGRPDRPWRCVMCKIELPKNRDVDALVTMKRSVHISRALAVTTWTSEVIKPICPGCAVLYPW